MKKIAGKIAILLILVIVASMFTSCLSWWLITGEPLNIGSVNGEGAILLIFLPVIDVVLFPIALTVFCVRKGIESARNKRGEKWDGVDTFSAVVQSLPDAKYNSLMKKFDSLPQAELNSLERKFYSLPTAEINSYSQTLKTFSVQEVSVMSVAINSLSQAQINSLIRTFNSMPEEKLVSIMNKLQRVKSLYLNQRIEQ